MESIQISGYPTSNGELNTLISFVVDKYGFGGIDLDAERELIKQKKSKLSRSRRDVIETLFSFIDDPDSYLVMSSIVKEIVNSANPPFRLSNL